MAAAVAGTVGGLYFVVTQDLGHGPGHDEDHHAEGHETHGKNEEGEDDDTFQDEDNTSGDKDKSQGGPRDDVKNKNANPSNPPKEEQNDEQPEDPSQPGAGRPDKNKSADTSGDDMKATESDKVTPDKADKVRTTAHTCRILHTDIRSPTLAASPSPPTKPRASKKASPTATPTTARRSPSRRTRARRARVLPRPLSSRAPSPLSVLELRTKRSGERPSKTRTHKLKPLPLPLPSKHLICHSIPAATSAIAAPCIVCESTFIVPNSLIMFAMVKLTCKLIGRS